MSPKPANNYHCEVVGSLLRPEYLKDATRTFDAGEITAAQLTAVQEQASIEGIRLQEETGVECITDGEMRRRGWTAPLTESLNGYGRAPLLSVNYHGTGAGGLREGLQAVSGTTVPEGAAPVTMGTAVIGKLSRKTNMMLTEMQFVQQHSKLPTKITFPSLAHASVLWSPGVSDQVYPDRAQAMHEILEIVAGLVQECIDAGCTYIQMDSPRYTHLVSEATLENFRRVGLDPRTWLGDVIAEENELIDRFPNVTWALHLCRGNGARGAWAVDGGYDPIAEQLFNDIHVDRLFLEYDSPRAGTFAPLRFVPKGKVAVLGLVSTKDRELESEDLLKRRLDEATQYLPLDQIALSPQCGFASAFEGNVTEEMQRAKLERMSSVVRQVWK